MPKIADEAKAALKQASREADGLGQKWWIGCEHLLLGLLSDRQSSAGRALAQHGVELESARTAIRRMVGDTRRSWSWASI